MNTLGQASGGSPLDFATYGIAGLVIVGILLGWLWAKPAVDRLIEDKDRVEKQRDDLFAAMQNEVNPRMAEALVVLAAMRPIMEQVVQALNEARSAEDPQRGRRDA